MSLTEVIVRAGVGGRELRLDLARPVSLAIPLDFSTDQPRHFGAPAASSRPYAVPGFSGSVTQGASCNCHTLTLTPHCNGTHTECVGHLTREPLDAHRVVPLGLLPALLLSIEPAPARTCDEGTEPIPQPGDLLITRRSLEEAWSATTTSAAATTATAATAPMSMTTAATAPTPPAAMAITPTAPFQPIALVIRTFPNPVSKQHQDYSNQTPPFLSREAAELLVERGIEHLVVDLPSIDRAHDEGRLTAHRIFFGLPRGDTTLAHATRAQATVTELAYIPDTVADGPYFLELQVPALGGDAVPSRPLLYPILSG